jgi:ABC-type dipeptide/oligopeptide/nickel transport system ATPase subunit
MNSDISYHLRKVVITHGLIPYFGAVLGFIALMAYLNYIETLTIAKMNSDNMTQVLLKLVIINFVYKIFLGIGKDQFQHKIFIPKLKSSILRYLSEFMVQVDPSYLETQEKIHLIVPDGASALENLSLNILNIIEPFFKIFSSVVALGSQVSSRALGIILGTLCLFFIFGLAVLRKDYVGRKNLQKEVNKYNDIVRNLWETYLVYYVNGLGPNTVSDIETNSLTADSINRNHKRIIYIFYWVLDWLQYTLSAFTTYYVFETSNKSTGIIEVFAMFYIISGFYGLTWWLFCTVRDALTSTATWGTIEIFIENYKQRDTDKLAELTDPSQILSPFQDSSVSEIRLYAESGGGKTTWMSRKVVSMMKTYKDGWLYLDQRMRLPKDLRTISQTMGDYIYTKVEPELYSQTLCKYAQILGIDNLINESTLDKKFEKPSGGEEKRILTLRAFLPILLGISKVKIIFNDEITAGLDDKNWGKVREIIDEIKTKFGIKFVTIDHHDFSAPKLIVKKKTRKSQNVKTKPLAKSLVAYLGSMFTSGIVKNNDDKDKKGIDVWIDGLEPEPSEEPECEVPVANDSDTQSLLEMV